MEGRPQSVRAWHRKRRTGCLTCKIRHVRCDEAKPDCKRCISTGRQCDGYTTEAGSHSKSIPIIQSLSVFPNTDPKERRAFVYFIENTSLELSGYFSSKIWSESVPRLGASQSALWHIIVALSSVHEGFSHGIQPLKRDSQLASYSFGLKHYSKSVKELQEAICLSPESLEPILLCCALFVCFDSLRSNYSAVNLHLQSGLKILLNHKAANGLNSNDENIIQIFTRLGLQAGVFMDTHRPESTRTIWQQLSAVNSDMDLSSFNTIDDARHKLNLILTNFMSHHVESQHDDDHVGYETSIQDSNVEEELNSWSIQFDAMILRKDTKNLSPNALRASILLKLHHACLCATSNAFLTPDPPQTPFQTIVSLSRSLIKATSASKRTKASISSDLGLVGPLFVTISRCTIPHLRWEALDLLKAVPTREGMWNSEVIANIARKVLEVEELQNPGGVHDMDKMETKIQEIRIKYLKDKVETLENQLRVDLRFERSDLNTGAKVLVTETLLEEI